MGIEASRRIKHTSSKLIQYDRIELIKPSERESLIADLESRLGFKVDKVEVGHVDFLKDSAILKVYYDPDELTSSTINDITKIKDYEK